MITAPDLDDEGFELVHCFPPLGSKPPCRKPRRPHLAEHAPLPRPKKG